MAGFLGQALMRMRLLAGEVSHGGTKARREQNENADTRKI